MEIFLKSDTDCVLNRAMLQTWRTKKYSYKNNARLDYGFLYLISGRITYTFHGDSIELRAGDIIYLPKGSYYEAEFDVSAGEVKNYLINFDVSNSEDLLEVKNPFLYHRDDRKILSGYFRDVVTSFNDGGNSFYTKSLFYLAIHTLASVGATENKGALNSLLCKGAEFLTERQELSVGEIAKELHISRSAFQKGFKEAFGVSPVGYRKMKRLEKAKMYLDTTDMPIKEIAEELGFYDLSYFYKVFTACYAVSPKKYREALKCYL